MAIQTEEMGREKEYRRRFYDQIVKEKNTHSNPREKNRRQQKGKKLRKQREVHVLKQF